MPSSRPHAEPGPSTCLRGAALALVLIGALARPTPARTSDALALEVAARQHGDAALAAGNVPEALRQADLAYDARRRRVGDQPRALTSLADSLGLGYFMAGSPEALEGAITWFDRARALRERSLGPEDLAVAQTLSTLATLHDYLGRFEPGLALERRSLAIREARLPAGERRIADSQRQIGQFLFELGRYDEAARSMAPAVAAYDSLALADPTPLIESLNAMGEIDRVLNRFPEAERDFRRAVELAHARLAADDPMRPVLANNLAGLYKDLGRYDDAEPLLIESLAARTRAEPADSTEIATAQLNLAELYRLQGRPEDARPLYDAALATSLAALGADHPDRVLFVNQAAVLYASLGNYARAESLTRETGATIARVLGREHPLYAQYLHDDAGMLAAQHRYAEADSAYAAAARLRERVLGPGHPDLAVTRVRWAIAIADDPHGDPARARALVDRALAVLDSTGAEPEQRLEAIALVARLEDRAGDRVAATADLERALAAVDQLRARRGGGDRTRAAYIAQHLELYDTMVRWQIEAGRVDAAFTTHERARARALLDQIAGSGVDLRAGIPTSEREPLERVERAARDQLAIAQRSLDAMRARADLSDAARLEGVARLGVARDSAAWALERSRDAIQDRSPVWRELLSRDGRSASTGELRAALASRPATVVEYHVGLGGSFVFVIPPAPAAVRAWPLRIDDDDAHTLRVPAGPLTAAGLEQLIAGRYDARAFAARVGIADELSGVASPEAVTPFTAAGEPDPRERRLHALWHVLMPEAAWAQVAHEPRALVVPDGALHLLPFEALVVTTRAGKQPVRYWLDLVPATLYAASATSFLSLRHRDSLASAHPQPGMALLSVCDPAFASSSPTVPTGDSASARSRALERTHGWVRLPGTRLESDRVARAFAPGPVEVLSDTAANEPRTRAALPGKRFVHLATHGFVTDTRGELLAGLALAAPRDSVPRSDDDGLLQLYEIYELHLGCELAVLSACETHRGPRFGGEGVFALSRGFLAAGAERVVASLWAVRDDATAALIGGFFERVAREKTRGLLRDDARLLGDAKRAWRAKPAGDDPTTWAAFILTGAP